MKQIILQTLTEALPVILNVVIVGIMGLLSKEYKQYINTDIKKSVIADTVKYIEQIYMDIHGYDKLNAAKDKAAKLLKNKGIDISDSELTVLIESAVNNMNKEAVVSLLKSIDNKTVENFDISNYNITDETLDLILK